MTGIRTSIVVFSLCVACSGGVADKALLVQPGHVSLAPGATMQLSATVVRSDGTTADARASATWTASDPAKATVAGGLVTAKAGGSVTITAAQGKLSGSATIEISSAVLKAIAIAAPRTTVPRGFSEQLSAIGVYDDGSTQDLTGSVSWSTGDASVATAGGGQFIAVATGAVAVTASANGVSATLQMTVSSASLTAVAVSPAAASLPAGVPMQLRATGAFDDGSSLDLTPAVAWSSAGASVADVSSAGVVTAKSAGGPIAITALHVQSGHSAAAQITVSSATLVSVAVTGASATLPVGLTRQLAATGTYSDGSTQDLTSAVTWSSDGPAVTVDASTGLATAAEVGDANVTALHVSGLAGAVAIHADSASLQRLIVAPAALTLPLGAGYALTATGVFDDGTTQDVTGSVDWSTDAGTVVALSGNVVMSLHGGAAHVTATFTPLPPGSLAPDASISSTIDVEIVAAGLDAIAVGPAATVPQGGRQQLTATAVFGDGSTADLTAQASFSSNDCDGLATLTPGGLLTALTSEGSCTVSAHDPASGKDGSAGISFSAPQVVQVFVEPPSATISAGQQVKLAGLALMSNGLIEDVSDQLNWWQTTDGSVASADSNGLVTGYKKGGPITIHFGNQCEGECGPGALDASATITVTDAVLVGLRATPAAATMPNGTSLQLDALALYSDGTFADVTAQATFGAGDGTHVSMDAGGLAHAHALTGAPVSVLVSALGMSDTVQLSVGPAALTAISLSPSVPSVFEGATVALTALGAYTDGTSGVDVTSQLTWSSSAGTLATVSSAGVVTGVKGGNPTIRAADPASGVFATVPLTVLMSGVAHLTDVPVLSPDPAVPSTTLTVSLKFTTDTVRIRMTIRDAATGNQLGVNNGFTVSNQTSADVPVTLGCFGAGSHLYAELFTDGTNGSTYYSRPAGDTSGLYAVQQNRSSPFLQVNGHAALPIPTAAVASPPDGACVFPAMSGAPVLEGPPTQGAFVNVDVTISPDTKYVQISLVSAEDNSITMGFGDLSPSLSGTDPVTVVVPVRLSCFTSAVHVWPLVYLQRNAPDTTPVIYSEYLLNPDTSPTNYTLVSGDPNGSSGLVATTTPVPLAAWQAGSGCVLPAMTAAPTISPSSAAPGDAVTVSVPINAYVDQVQVTLIDLPDQHNAGQKTVSGITGGAQTVEVPITINSNTPANTYYAYIYLTSNSEFSYAQYIYVASRSATNYAQYVYEGFGGTQISTSAFPLGEMTVTGP